MSFSLVTPKAKPKTPATASKRKRAAEVDADEGTDGLSVSGMGGDAPRVLAGIVRAEVKEAFGEDKTWYGSSFLAPIATLEGRRVLEDYVHLWLVFFTAFEHGLSFGPKNMYNARNPQLVADFIVEQWGVRPEQIQRFSSGGKTIRYLLTFGDSDLRKVVRKFPRGLVKLARGLGCRLLCPSEQFRSPFPATITHAPAGGSVLAMRQSLLRESFIKAVSDFERVTYDNNVKSDKILVMVETEEMVGAPVTKDKESFTFEFFAEGFRLELSRRQSCMTCGNDDHLSPSCPTKQKLVSADMKTWSYVVDIDDEGPSGQGEGTILTSEELTRIADKITQGITGAEEEKSVVVEPEKVKAKKKSSRKRKSERKVEETGPPAKKAKN
jgi:hypothetical protein